MTIKIQCTVTGELNSSFVERYARFCCAIQNAGFQVEAYLQGGIFDFACDSITPERVEIVETWHDLLDVVTDYHDDFSAINERLMIKAHSAYRSACQKASEGYFSLIDVNHLVNITEGYPETPSSLETLQNGSFKTDLNPYKHVYAHDPTTKD